jgi:hypothetical protein
LGVIVGASGIGIHIRNKACAQIHERVIPFTRIPRIQRLGDERRQFRIGYLIASGKEEMQEDAANVGFYKHGILGERERAYCAGRCGTDSGKGAQRSMIRWNESPIHTHNNFRGSM